MGQLGGTIKDFCNNYIDMLNANLKSSDDEKKEYRTTDNYYHCKANYNAAHRGSVGHTTAIILGNAREAADLPYNFKKGKTWRESWQDRENDLAINRIGRQRALSNQFKSAQDACTIFKPKSLNEDEEYKKWYR